MAHKRLNVGRRAVLHHPELIPIQCRVHAAAEGPAAESADDVRLRFLTELTLPAASFLEFTVWALGEAQTFVAQVVCCDEAERGYDTQVRFLTPDDAYRARIVEQICHIEAYRRKVQEEEGRTLVMDRAAEEWIHMNAEHFPSF